MLDATIGRRKRQLPTTWNELTRRQLLDFARLAGQPFATDIEQRHALLRLLLQVPARVIRQLTPVQRVSLSGYTHFLREPRAYGPLTKQLLPWIACSRFLPWARALFGGLDDYARLLFGPLDNFRNLRFAEFIFADTYFLRYLQCGYDEQQLDNLVAVLYRPQRRGYNPTAPDYQGDRRQDFNEHHVAARAALIGRRVPHHVKWAVLLWYQGCRQSLERTFPYVFTEGNTASASTSGWTEVLHTLADGVHRLDATAQQPLKTVLREMNLQLRRAEERAE
jgi:hypothetical protein